MAGTAGEVHTADTAATGEELYSIAKRELKT
jgi:hypothetical protein